MDLQLNGKRALVTGSSSGIGIGIARSLAAEGVVVAVHGRDAVRANDVAADIRACGGQCVVVLGDLATNEGAKVVADAAVAAMGGVDILVNNAGGRAGTAGGSTWFDVSFEVWAATYEKNIISAVRLVHMLAPAMKQRGWGRIIQISSGIAATPIGAIPDYSSSKAAMVNMSLGLSKALANTGVTVNTVSPGMIDTPSIGQWFDDIAKQQGWGSDRKRVGEFVLREYVHQTVNRVGRVDDVGAAVAYLASPVSDFINGANLRVDGGNGPSVN
jgi:3-oxoacyl-[acyl-carrier protein] reductase